MERKILIADDNEGIRDILTTYCRNEGYATITAADGVEALELFRIYAPSLVLLDVLMPGLNGFEVCRSIRRVSDVPIIMVTARGEDADRILGLDTGADDYVVKPFSPGEVMARIRAILRRLEVTTREQDEVLRLPQLEIDINDYIVRISGHPKRLTRKEIEILWVMASHPGKVFTRDNLLDSVWGADYFGDARTVDTHVKRLRAKLDLPEDFPWTLVTVWGVGYKLEVRHAEA